MVQDHPRWHEERRSPVYQEASVGIRREFGFYEEDVGLFPHEVKIRRAQTGIPNPKYGISLYGRVERYNLNGELKRVRESGLRHRLKDVRSEDVTVTMTYPGGENAFIKEGGVSKEAVENDAVNWYRGQCRRISRKVPVASAYRHGRWPLPRKECPHEPTLIDDALKKFSESVDGRVVA